MGAWAGLPMTYAGGAATFADVELVEAASGGAVDVTVGSALDLFGGTGMKYEDLVRWNQRCMSDSTASDDRAGLGAASQENAGNDCCPRSRYSEVRSDDYSPSCPVSLRRTNFRES